MIYINKVTCLQGITTVTIIIGVGFAMNKYHDRVISNLSSCISDQINLNSNILDKIAASFIPTKLNVGDLFAEPGLFNRVPLKMIASMLGITPETLSRLRVKHS